MKYYFFFILCLVFSFPILAQAKYDLQVVAEINTHGPIGQLRAVPVSLGKDHPKCIAAMYSEDAEIDPYIGMFFFPKHTLKIVLFDENGKEYWKKDIGGGMVPGIWFSPIFSFDMDHDGVDEIYIVNNDDPEHPMDYRRYVLEKIDSRTGKSLGTWKWPQPAPNQSTSHTYRHFILGGYVKGEPVLITAQGTYGPTVIQGWNNDMSKRWEFIISADTKGGKGSHVTPVVDLNHDGIDELIWGERAIDMDQGKQLFCADEDNWTGHSDIIQPVLDYDKNKWYIFTCREEFVKQPPRVVMFDNQGKIVWKALEEGHIDTGWSARIGENGQPFVLGVKVGEKIRTAEGERRTGVVENVFEAFSGKPTKLGFDVYTSIPVDLNGDGVHELVKGYFEGDGTILDNKGNKIGNIGGSSAMACKFTGRAGEQILSYSTDGKIRIWADKNAKDNQQAIKRYQHPYYLINHRLTGCGYNLFNLGGI